MRSRNLVLAGAVISVAAPAWGALVLNFSGPIKIKLSNFDTGAQYAAANGTYSGESTINALPQTPPPGALPNEDSWGILQVEEIVANDGSNKVLYERGTAAAEITAIFWGARDTYLNVTGSGTASEVQVIHSVGMHAAFFLDPAKNYTGNAGPSARSNSTSNPATNVPGYPTVTDGTLLWTMNSAPGFDTNFPTDEFFTTYSPSGSLLGGLAAAGGFYADLGSVPGYGVGTQNNMFQTVSNAPDITVQFTGRTGTSGWLVNSDDPILGTLVPEPGSISLLVFSGAGLLARRRGPLGKRV